MNKTVIKKIAYLSIPVLILVFFFVALHFAKAEPKEETDLPYTVVYYAEKGGTIEGQKIQRVEKGNSTGLVHAIPDEGYYFVQWSDGLTTPTRQETDVQQYTRLTAEFATITDGIEIQYQAGIMGYIQGKQEQTVQKGTESWTVVACPFEDAIFIRWTDGLTTPTRQDQNITEPFSVTAEFGYSITYTKTGGGQIKGEAEQTLPYGELTTEVTAVPDAGYTFTGWSDGLTDPTRKDSATAFKELTAYFEWKEEYEFHLTYNYATGNCTNQTVHLKRGESKGKTINVPTREHFNFCGWYLDETYTEQATDETGKIIIDEIFDQPSRELYAKWEVKKEDVVTYKILMVYVTAIDANLMGNDQTMVELHYRMSDEERQMCNEITRQFSDAINEMLEGLVQFEIDSYFTTKPVDESSFDMVYGYVNGVEQYAYYIDADSVSKGDVKYIPELRESGILDDYRSVLTVYSMNADENLIKYTRGGMSGEKYGCILYDDIMANYKAEVQISGWKGNYITHLCIHEFIHTAEMSFSSYNYHQATVQTTINTTVYEDTKKYCFNQYPIATGEKVGIPYTFWANEICKVNFQVESKNGVASSVYTSPGYIVKYREGYTVEDTEWWWRYSKNVPKGSRTTYIYAKVNPGYRFIGWSDGCTDQVRIFTDVQEDITLIAYYERVSYTAEYQATEGGHIEGTTIQTTLFGEYYDRVYAIAEEGYRFVGWSDGDNSNPRIDISGGRRYNIETEQWEDTKDLTVTAIFEKIEDTEN